MSPKIYYLHPLIAGPVSRWGLHLERCQAMGFDHVCTAPLFRSGNSGNLFLTADYDTLHPALGMNGTQAETALGSIAALCAKYGLKLLLDLVIDRVSADNVLAACNYGWFRFPPSNEDRLPDPRHAERRDTAYPRFDDPEVRQALIEWWVEKLIAVARAGVAGFRCVDPAGVSADIWRDIIAGVQSAAPECRFLVWTPGVAADAAARLAGAGFSGAFSSVAWWDGRASWLCEEAERLRQIGPPIGSPEAPYASRLAAQGKPGDEKRNYLHALRLAAASSNGLLIPMGFEFGARRKLDPVYAAPEDFEDARAAAPFDLSDDIRAANDLVDRIAAFGLEGQNCALTSAGSPVTALLRTDAPDVRYATQALVMLINPSPTETRAYDVPLSPLPPSSGAAYGMPVGLDDTEVAGPLAPGEIRLLRVERLAPVTVRGFRGRQSILRATKEPRIAIEHLSPAIDDGRFPVKRVVGEKLTVEADIFADGHDVLAADLLWRTADKSEWQRVVMAPGENDRWKASFAPTHIGRHFFTVEAWWDVYGTFCRDIERKQAAGVDIALELEEGRLLLEETEKHAGPELQVSLGEALGRFGKAGKDKLAKLNILLDPATRRAMDAGAERPFLAQHEPAQTLDVERPQAGFASWYELFPRSATDDPKRHGTFADVIRRMPAIRAMGFDTLYFPPIHPIGTVNRKGRNNALKAGVGDVGSPYAIGSAEGGHDAIHPALGTIEDFRRMRDAARQSGLELALDFAVQNAPDHPWLQEHPDWFRYRPDGSVRFAENPPKKYEDIVNPDFYAEAAIPDLWAALRDVILHWTEEGVRIFRIDNPHTKPLPFWEWLIADIRGRYPDVIFLAEAFTRPKLMYRLAKLGFSQSYSYFTWRNTKSELTEYLTELTTSEVKDYFRPHFFVNTPDINPVFLQGSGRPGFLIRAALAATLSGLWGIYSGFELCEAAPLPGREEYLDSEKYEIRVRDYAAPGNIIAEIAVLNRIRKANPALQTHLGVKFYNAFNDQMLVYGKALLPLRDMILVAVCLDAHAIQEANFEMPLWEWGLPDDASLAVEDLVRGGRFVLTGKNQRMRLDPNDLPYAIWRLAPLGGGI